MTSKRNRCSRLATEKIARPSPVGTEHMGRMHLSHRRIWMSISLLFVMLGLCRPSQAQIVRDYTYNPNHYDATKVIQAMKTPQPNLVIVSAHRGLHSVPGDNPNVPGLPENSLAAVGGAAQAGLELLELDIKQTPDGQLTFSHDKTWGRQAVPANGSTPFNPFEPPAGQTAVNLPLATTSMTTLQANWVLRDSVTLLYPSNPEPPPTLQQVIAFYNQHQLGCVIAFDVKDTDTFKKAWAVVSSQNDFRGRNFSTDVVWKVGGNNYKTAADFKADFPGSLNGSPEYLYINYWPVYNTSDIAPPSQAEAIPPPDAASTANTPPTSFGSEAAILSSLNSIYADGTIAIISAEITQKQPGGILDTLRQMNLANGRSAAEFSATGDYFDPNDATHTAQFFASADGSCCQKLSQFYYNGAPYGQPSDTSDDRGSLSFVLGENFNIITADTALDWAGQLSSMGLRNLTPMQETGYGGDSHCNVGTGQYPGCDDANTPGQTTYTLCAPEGGACTFTGDRNVAYGANGSYRTVTATNTIVCNTNTPGFSPDPAPGVVKACYISPPIPYVAGTYCADESQTCNFGGDAWAIMAANGKTEYSSDSTGYAVLYANQFSCDVSLFSRYGGSDPAPNIPKACFYQGRQGYLIPHSGPAGYVFCSGEDDANGCQFKGRGRVAYGRQGYGGFNYGVYADGVACSNSVFGDPASGYTKDCFYQSATAVSGATGTEIGQPPAPSTGTGTGADQSCSGSGCPGGTDATLQASVGGTGVGQASVGGGGGGNAATFVGSPVVAEANSYNYSPTVIQTGNVQQFWWCASASSQYQPSGSDAIIYESIDLQSGNKVGPFMVLAEGDSNAWDHKYTCNPKVIKGVFSNPIGDGQTYTYAMYFVATSQENGTLNSIGVAFSNDGIGWHKYPLPIITYPATDIPNKYGVGQPAAYNSDGGSAIWLFFEGNNEQSHYKVTSTDGVHFSNQQTLTTNGLQQVQIAGQSTPAPVSWGDMAYDSATGLWYAAYNMNTRAPSTTGGSDPERGQMGVMIYRIPNSSLISGDTPWQQVTSIDTNLTGFEGNFIASFLRDGNGNINIGPYPQIEVYSSSSVPAPAWNASPLDRGNSNAVGRWQIAWSAVVPDQPTVAFNRYYNGIGHEVTTGYVDKSIFHLESTLGYLYNTPQGSATTALYGCLNGNTNYFVSPDSACEGQLFLGINGYISPTPGLDLIPLYRCSAPGDHFVSTSASCEGTTYEQLLGYVYQPKVAFNRYYGSVHQVTTGSVDTSVFNLESTLGNLYSRPQGSATTALYACLNGSLNYFVSPDSACEGQHVLGLNGYASPNPGTGLIPLYRCKTRGDHFVSPSASCEGQTYEQLLGYVLDPNQTNDPSTVAFNRYYGSFHQVTTGSVDDSIFNLESTLGYLYKRSQGSATTALYGCLNGSTNFFVSPNSACEGQQVLGLNGYASPNPGTGLVPLYRCKMKSDHFVSTSASCEGQTYEQLLGYVPTN